MKKFLFLLVGILMATAVHADELTHTIGNTGYMIREAMWAHAKKYDGENYKQAVKLQYQARRALRGTAKKGLNRTQALELTKQAYDLAKTARDTSLQAQNLTVAE